MNATNASQYFQSTSTNTSTPKCTLGTKSISTRTALTCAYLLVFIAALVGNTVVIYIVRGENRLKISFNYFILSMASADLLHALSAIPASVAYLYVRTAWFPGPFGLVMCKFVHYAVTVSIVASITTLSVTTIERYLAARLILKKPMTMTFARRAIVGIWTFSAVISVNEVLTYAVEKRSDSSYHCIALRSWRHTYPIEMIVKFIVTYAFPLVTMGTLYTIIIWVLWQYNAKGVLNGESYRKIQKRKKNLIKRLITITGVFAVCWFPVHVNHFLGTFYYETYKCIPQYWILVFYWMAHANSAVNPFLYLMLTRNTRALFRSSVHAARPDGNDTGSRRTVSRRRWMLNRFPNDSRLLTACFSTDSTDYQDEQKMNEVCMEVKDNRNGTK